MCLVRSDCCGMVPYRRQPTHPGEVLLEEFLKPGHISQVDFARKIGVPVQRINTIVRGKRGITTETALKLSEALHTSPELWMNLQSTHDLYHASARMRKAA